MIYGSKRLLFRLGKGCNTGCNGCSDNYIPQDNYEISELKRNIKKSFQVFYNDFNLFFFGIDPLLYSDIEELLSYVSTFEPKGGIGIQISDINQYTPMHYKILAYFLQTYRLKVYVSTSIENLNNYNLKSLLQLCEFFSANFSDDISFQIYYKAKKNLTQSKNFRLLSRYKDLKLDISDALQIDNKQQIVTSEDTSCKYHNAFSWKNNDIYLKDFSGNYDLEISLNGDIRPHIPRCYLADIKISNILFTAEKRLHDFKEFDNYLNGVNNREKSFEHNCYNCIIYGKYSYK